MEEAQDTRLTKGVTDNEPAPLFDHQYALNAHILTAHPELAGVDLLQQKILALQVELGELANEFVQEVANETSGWGLIKSKARRLLGGQQ